MNKRHTISVLVENNSGALSRISGLFSARGYNIASLSVSATEDHGVSRMTIVALGDDAIIEQITKQLNRLIDVIKVLDFKDKESVDRELMVATIQATHKIRHEIVSLLDIYNGKILSVSNRSLVIEVSERSDVLDDFIAIISPYGIREIARSGPVALAKPKMNE
ncbi:acetolactate synthase small subunit [Chitinivibrio alkaliphilus]|uniref:Acetolactate synthase small subunit n=1 Tax=Chitinivibrio alkaliphilus ACht1 TaxID=1313304 RepID=U7DB57_9BACT|nr:acetolactate synthase small subunit [Chitinivibrio alkaliphilus]ERP31650.1 acetolactate synthase 3 regulatory subunit [Chitinivibrio alkaliphilus ACht1]